ncbi:phage tail sheath family protein [Paraburkholderia domus]|uniref:Tail sheath protein C-terminal domain-containing protein n=1 Tax=Paraburkholderia domus TaxID=2793075 RepID=A0A9N8N207_9BURK|nr:phage tail sheath family protein [Paraburkholderia domus]MBK5166546.1 phage tail sheath family protein [Burkholderia sp. R-70211]CAE6910003.1 hypothetical protein R70211_03849 [Paraburkholderia domus]
MPVTVSYPGVYVEEDASPSLSINNSATAVPAIIVGNDDRLVKGSDNQQCMRITSWLDYVKNVKTILGEDYAFDFGSSDDGHRDTAIRAYFENGGGYCYLVLGNCATARIPCYDDISLIVGQGVLDVDSADIGTLCQPGTGRFAIMDGSQSEMTSTYKPAWQSNPCVAVYYPYLRANWTSNNIPPSVVVAGIYCSVDRTRGVWKAPANVYLPANYQPLYKVIDDLQGQFNSGLAINMIRNAVGGGTVVWGARTLEDSDNWRYIPVRRLFDSAERDIKSALRSMVFEPNGQPVWEKVRSAITNYLYGLWQAGALVGESEKEAYFVQIGEGLTMTSDDIAQGKMIVNVGMAAVRPAEFIVLQFTQNVGQG